MLSRRITYMIPATKSQILVAEDWVKIYQTFKNADFKSYDFETLRRVAFQYLQQNYPEDFNDYIDSSEFVALVDLIAYLGQNLSFRIDLNARENFLETAQRTDSVLRLAQLVSYNPARNVPATGLLKITAIQTSDTIFDSNGINLANQVVAWNDPSNNNWYQQFISIMSSVMPNGTMYGTPYDSATIDGIQTDQYRINTQTANVPLFTFSKLINGINMSFEIVSSGFSGKNYIYEETPLPGRNMGFIWRNDNQGAASASTGFFMHFKQGTLGTTSFVVDTPVANEIVALNVNDINNTDVWLWQLDASGAYSTEWTKVDSTVGNNVIYNSISLGNRNIYAVSTRANDQIDLNFADGNFGNLPKGTFQLFYRQSNGLAYTVGPNQLDGVIIKIPYINKSGQIQNLSLTLSLQSSISNSAPAETIADIKKNAPQNYYIQNRMITGEDYNIAPVTIASNVLKAKSVNRQSSGISKYFDLTDVTGRYSSTDIIANDGILYKEYNQRSLTFTYTTRNEAFGILKGTIEPLISDPSTRNFYVDNFPRPDLINLNLSWTLSQAESNQTRGFLKGIYDSAPMQLGAFSGSSAKYITAGALVKFVAPTGKYFLPSGKFTTTPDATTKNHLWSKVAKVTGDGANQGKGVLNDGTGPVILTGYVPDGAIATDVIPNLVTTLPFALENEIVNQIMAKRNFGLSFDINSRAWFVVVDTNIDFMNPFALIYQGDVSNTNIDASWQIGFQWTGKSYVVFYRQTNYVFESYEQTGFFVDDYKTNFDFVNNTLIKDKISVLSINTLPNLTNTWLNGSGAPTASLGANGNFYLDTSANVPYRKISGVWGILPLGQTFNELGTDYEWQIDAPVVENDGYVEPKKVLISFYDGDNNGQIKDPDSFNIIVDPLNPSIQTGYLGNFVYFEYLSDGIRYQLTDFTQFTAFPTESSAGAYFTTLGSNPADGQLFYFYESDVIKSWSASELIYVLNTGYFARPGRSGLKFHYQHNSGVEKRIDPAKSNIIDIYLLTSNYDIAYRQWATGNLSEEPTPPTPSDLEDTYSQYLEPIKSVSDSIIYHSASYKVLFGSNAPINLQATFKAVRNPTLPTSDNDLKTRILSAINNFFSIENWDFGDTFYFSELSAYIMNTMTPDITNFVIVPNNGSTFGNLFEVTCQSDEIFVSGATVNDIEIISAVTASSISAAGVSQIS